MIVCPQRTRWFFRTLTIGFVLGLALDTLADTKADRPPNVVLIISDDQAWNDYRSWATRTSGRRTSTGSRPRVSTFTRGYVPSSLCSPSLATILTGPLSAPAQGHQQRPAAARRAEAAGRLDDDPRFSPCARR